MKSLFTLLFFTLLVKINAQVFNGQVFMRENSSLYLNQVFVTNITIQKTIISNYNGEFKINANIGDVIRFTSIISERTDVKVTDAMLKNPLNFIELKPGYHDIKEVVIGWKPSGNLRKDVMSLKDGKRKMELASIIGLPQGKEGGVSPEQPLVAFQGGGLSFNVQAIYDVLSGERKKKQRLYEYEQMMTVTSVIRKYFGDDFFIKQKIPQNMIDNFLQFVYSSDNILLLVQGNNLEATKIYMDRYLPIYLKRLKASNMMEVNQN